MGDIPILSEEPTGGSEQLESVPVYNLVALVETAGNNAAVRARAANIRLDPVQATTIRDALNKLVTNAKAILHAANSEPDADSPWIEPPNTPSESETRFIVPLHL